MNNRQELQDWPLYEETNGNTLIFDGNKEIYRPIKKTKAKNCRVKLNVNRNSKGLS